MRGRCMGKGESRRTGVVRVRKSDFFSILLEELCHAE